MIKHHTGFFVSVWHDADETPTKFIMNATCGRCGKHVAPEKYTSETLTGVMLDHHMECFVTSDK